MWFEPESINDSCLLHWQAGRKPGLELEGPCEVPIGGSIGSRASSDAAN